MGEPATRTFADPAINPETAPFWEAAARGELALPHCADCGRVHWYPRAVCPFCWSGRIKPVAACGRGTIHAFTVMRRVPVPYALAYVRLEEGVTMMTNIVECDLDTLAIGQPVRVAFVTSEGGQAIPVFRPA